MKNINNSFALKAISGDLRKVENEPIKQSFKNDNEFIQFYVENLDYVNTVLKDFERKVLFQCLMDMNRSNCIRITADIKKVIQRKTKLNRNQVGKALTSLIDKGILIKIEPSELDEDDRKKLNIDLAETKQYLISPNVAGKSSFRDMVKMREVVVKYFNFEKLEFKKEVLKESDYVGFNEIQKEPMNFQIKNVKSNQNKSGGQDFEVIIGKTEKTQQPPLFEDNAPTMLTVNDEANNLLSDNHSNDNHSKEMLEYMKIKQEYEEDLKRRYKELQEKIAEQKQKQ